MVTLRSDPLDLVGDRHRATRFPLNLLRYTTLQLSGDDRAGETREASPGSSTGIAELFGLLGGECFSNAQSASRFYTKKRKE